MTYTIACSGCVERLAEGLRTCYNYLSFYFIVIIIIVLFGVLSIVCFFIVVINELRAELKHFTPAHLKHYIIII